MILDICTNPDTLEVIYIVNTMINVIKIGVPIALIIALMVTFMLAIKSGNEDLLAKTKQKVKNRVIAAVLIFLIPTFVNFILTTVGGDNSSINNCLNNAKSHETIEEYRVELASKLVSQAEEQLTFSAYSGAITEVNKLKDVELKKDFIVRLDAVNENIKVRMERVKKEEEAKRLRSIGLTSVGDYQSWKQGNPDWGSIHLGNSSETIASAGCLVTSIAIQINASGVQTPFVVTPGTLVQKLNQIGGFTSGGSLYWAKVTEAVPNFVHAGSVSLSGQSRESKLSQINNYIGKGYYIVAEVKGNTGQHWVAVTGTTANSVNMVDPASDAVDMWVKYDWSNTSEFHYYQAVK